MGNSWSTDAALFPDINTNSRIPDQPITEGFPIKQDFDANDRSSTIRLGPATSPEGESKVMSIEENKDWPGSYDRPEDDERLSSIRISRPVVKSLGYEESYMNEPLTSRPSEELDTIHVTTERPSMSFKAKKRKKSLGRGKSSRKSRVGPTVPKPGPTSPLIITCRRGNGKKKGKKKRAGPTRPGPTQPPSDNESSDAGEYHSGNASIVRHQENMPNWKQPWENIHRIQGLQVDDKSETMSPRRDFQFIKDCGIAVNIRELRKEGQVSTPVRRRMYFREDLHFEEDDREQDEISPRQKPRHSVRSLGVMSAASGETEISNLSLAPPINTRSRSIGSTTLSEISSLSDLKDEGESPSIVLQTPYINDYMPNKSWASPHCKDYDEDPYYMQQIKLSHKEPKRVQ